MALLIYIFPRGTLIYIQSDIYISLIEFHTRYVGYRIFFVKGLYSRTTVADVLLIASFRGWITQRK